MYYYYFYYFQPFRLTKQFMNAMRPLETSGYFNKCMSHVVRTFRSESDSLMAALEVFLGEPIKSSNQPLSSSIGDSEKILRTIKMKLSGINPIIPIEKDLTSGVLSRYIQNYLMRIFNRFDYMF